MRKLIGMIAGVVATVALLCGVLVGCGGKGNNGDTTYTITVQSAGGAPIRDVAVSASEGTKVAYTGTTDRQGAYTFTAKGTEYTVSLDATTLPKGYNFDDSKEYKVTKANPAVTISVTSSIITGETKPDGMYTLGDILYDFTLPMLGGKTFTASKALEEKRMILLNFWHTRCNPCVSELPHIQAAYEQYEDVAAMLAIDVQDFQGVRDTAVSVSEFLAQQGLQFPAAVDTDYTVTFNSFLDPSSYSIPVTVVIDRYGVIAYWRVGSFSSEAEVEELFEKYSAEDYAQEIPDDGNSDDDGLPPYNPPPADFVFPDPSDLEVANGSNFHGTYDFVMNSGDEDYDARSWPWAVGDDNGTPYIYPANSGTDWSFAVVNIHFEVEVGANQEPDGAHLLAFDYMTSSESYDIFYVFVDGMNIYSEGFSGVSRNWQTCYVYDAASTGEHTMTFMFMKNLVDSSGEDRIKIKNIRFIRPDEVTEGSLDLPRNAASDWNEAGRMFDIYVDYAEDGDGYYHKDFANAAEDKYGPFLFVDMFATNTAFHQRTGDTMSLSDHISNGDFNYNTAEPNTVGYLEALDKTSAMSSWLAAASNSKISGVTVINAELAELLNEYVEKRYNSEYHEKSWLEFCLYFAHYGTDPKDDGINHPDENPALGASNATAFKWKAELLPKNYQRPSIELEDAEKAEDRAPEAQYLTTVQITTIVFPRGIRYVFDTGAEGLPGAGAYRIRTWSIKNFDTQIWLYSLDGRILTESGNQREIPYEECDAVLTYYFEANRRYIIAVDTADFDVYGHFCFTVEYLGEEAYVWQHASTEAITSRDEENLMGSLMNIMYVQPILDEDGYYYDVARDLNGNPIQNEFGNFTVDKNDPLYVNFLNGSRFSPNTSIEDVLTMGKEDGTRGILARVRNIVAYAFTGDKENGASYTRATTLASIKGSALTVEDYDLLAEQITWGNYSYGEGVYVYDDYIVDESTGAEYIGPRSQAFRKVQTIGDIVDFLKAYHLCAFDFTNYKFSSAVETELANRYKNGDLSIDPHGNYTEKMEYYLEMANMSVGTKDDLGKNREDKGSVRLSKELKDILELYARRYGWEELPTDYIRLVSHFEHYGPYGA